MGYVQEPLRFRYKPPTDDSTAITLSINPEALTLNFKKIVTPVRTKTRIVTFYWGQQPINFTYQGQTGNLYPSEELRSAHVATKNNEATADIDFFSKRQDELISLISELEDNITVLAERYGKTSFQVAEADRQLQEYKIELNTAQTTINSRAIDMGTPLPFVGENFLSQSVFANTSHTDVLKLSPKYQLFKKLQKFYENSRASSNLIQVVYRHYIFDGYFESFGFTDSAKDPWNWKYSINFTILSWEEMASTAQMEQMLI